MDYFQGVVTEYLRADRNVFVNTECLIQLEVGDSPAKGRHWYCDAVAVNLAERRAYLCEVTYSASLTAVVARLRSWATHWTALRAALARDSSVPLDWEAQPWLFIPRARHEVLRRKAAGYEELATLNGMPAPRVTYLESVTPWNYRTWNRDGCALEKSSAAVTPLVT